jgi:hypothetical protein
MLSARPRGHAAVPRGHEAVRVCDAGAGAGNLDEGGCGPWVPSSIARPRAAGRGVRTQQDDRWVCSSRGHANPAPGFAGNRDFAHGRRARPSCGAPCPRPPTSGGSHRRSLAGRILADRRPIDGQVPCRQNIGGPIGPAAGASEEIHFGSPEPLAWHDRCTNGLRSRREPCNGNKPTAPATSFERVLPRPRSAKNEAASPEPRPLAGFGT